MGFILGQRKRVADPPFAQSSKNNRTQNSQMEMRVDEDRASEHFSFCLVSSYGYLRAVSDWMKHLSLGVIVVILFGYEGQFQTSGGKERGQIVVCIVRMYSSAIFEQGLKPSTEKKSNNVCRAREHIFCHFQPYCFNF